MATEAFDNYRYTAPPSPTDTPEDGFPFTTAKDYDFDEFQQPPFTPPAVTELGRVAATIDPDASDLEANLAIINSAALIERSKPRVEAPAAREIIPSTYDMDAFIEDTEATYATDLLCTAWLELYGWQVETGDYPIVKEDRAHYKTTRLPRIVPRQLAEELPNGTRSEVVEIYLTPVHYLEYREAGLIPDSPGGVDGVPRIFWFEEDGDGYKAGTNAETIYRTEQMKPLSAANKRGTMNSVMLALAKIPTLPSVPKQDLKDSQDKKAADAERRQQTRYQRMGGSYYMHRDW